jgi:hypothetical protein
MSQVDISNQPQLKEEQIKFLLEESSMENLLNILLPKILPEGYALGNNCFLRPHEGKNDLKKSIPKKVKVFSNYHIPAKIIIIQDQDSQDSNDCKELKAQIVDLCNKSGDCPILVRISCRELENWYLGDMDAIAKVYPKFKPDTHRNKAKYRIIDDCFGAPELERSIKEFQKGFASKNIPLHMDIGKNNSESFRQLVSGIQKFL